MSNWPIKIMIYGAGEAIDGSGALAPQIQTQLDNLAKVATNYHVAATAQLDSSSLPTLRFVIDPRGRQPVEQLPEVNTGDPEELLRYVRWSSAICPADRNVVVLSGHGAAWEDSYFESELGLSSKTRNPRGIARVPGAIHHARAVFGRELTKAAAFTRFVLVDGSQRDYLSNAELGDACRRIATLLGGKIDVLVFDACLMSSWELLSELSGSVRCIVASIDELSASGIDLARPVHEMAARSGALEATGIAAELARHFEPRASFDSCVAIDLSSASWTRAASAFRDFCAALAPWVQQSSSNAAALADALRYASTSLVKFTAGGLSDVAILARAIGNIPNVPSSAVSSIQAAVAALGSCVLARSTGPDYASALGVSVFTPSSITAYQVNRDDYSKLQMPRTSGWAELLDVIYNGRGTRASVALPNDLDAAEFVVSLRGLPVTDDMCARLEKAIRRTVLEHLARVDLLADVNVLPVDRFIETRTRQLQHGITAGLVIESNLETRRPSAGGILDVQIVTTSDDKEFRVVLRGLQLDAPTKSSLDIGIRSAVLAEIGALDLGANVQVNRPQNDPQTRTLLRQATGTILGLVLTQA